MYFVAAILTSLGTVMYLGGKDPITSAFILVMGVAMIPITFYLRRLDKGYLDDIADLLQLFKEDYEEAQAKLDKLLTRLGGTVEDDLIEEDKAFIDEFIKDNP